MPQTNSVFDELFHSDRNELCISAYKFLVSDFIDSCQRL